MPHSPRRSKSAFRQVSPSRSKLPQRTSDVSQTSPPVAPSALTQSTFPSNVVKQDSGIWQSMKQGFGWGVGSSIARNMFGGGPTVSPSSLPVPSSVTPVSTNTTQDLVNQTAYTQCRKEGGDYEACAQYLSDHRITTPTV